MLVTWQPFRAAFQAAAKAFLALLPTSAAACFSCTSALVGAVKSVTHQPIGLSTVVWG